MEQMRFPKLVDIATVDSGQRRRSVCAGDVTEFSVRAIAPTPNEAMPLAPFVRALGR